MVKIDATQTELVGPGKYKEGGTRAEVPQVSLPFQIIETPRSIVEHEVEARRRWRGQPALLALDALGPAPL